MNRTELLDTLKSLVEARLDADDWLKWWKKNGTAVEKLIGAPATGRLKPNYPDSAAGAAHNSQTEALRILQEAGIPVKRSPRYHEEFVKFMDQYIKDSDAREKEKANPLKPRINLLKVKFPSLHACLFRNSKKVETFEPGASEKDIARTEKALKVKLPKSVREFFKLTKHFGVEGLELDLDLVFEHPGDKSAPDGKRHLCLGNYFWKDDGDQILVDISAPAADPKILYYAHSAPSPKIQPLAKNWKEFLEKLPKQYLNQMFYYS